MKNAGLTPHSSCINNKKCLELELNQFLFPIKIFGGMRTAETQLVRIGGELQ